MRLEYITKRYVCKSTIVIFVPVLKIQYWSIVHVWVGYDWGDGR